MRPIDDLLELAKVAVTRAGLRLLSFSAEQKQYVCSREQPKEIKALADEILERDILEALAPAGLPIISEESGFTPAREASDYRFIVDPLDGTYNFVRSLGPSAVCVALWQSETPIFGVIYDVGERQLVWGGAGIGAYVDGAPIAVSGTAQRADASICTGFPVRFDVADDEAMRGFGRLVAPYAKVRMLGSAAVSLLRVAQGSADAYAERNIMLWDVAAGLAIVEGAGGRIALERLAAEWCYGVFASNAHLPMRAEP